MIHLEIAFKLSIPFNSNNLKESDYRRPQHQRGGEIEEQERERSRREEWEERERKRGQERGERGHSFLVSTSAKFLSHYGMTI